MPELLWAQGGACRNFCGLRGGGWRKDLGGVCRNYCGLRGAMQELLRAHGRVCRNFGAPREGYAGTYVC